MTYVPKEKPTTCNLCGVNPPINRGRCADCKRKAVAAAAARWRAKVAVSEKTPADGDKICSKCRLALSASNFHRSNHTLDGLRHDCKSCSFQSRKYVSIEQRMLDNAKNRSKKIGVPCTITIEDISIPDRCPLLGTEIVVRTSEKFSGKGGNHARHNSPSLDRILPELGYIKGNVWVISYKANSAKNDLTVDELETLAANLRAKVNSCLY
jgi:hypothetical protein